MPITSTAQSAAEEIIRSHLNDQFAGQVRIVNVMPSTQFGQDDEEFLDVSVIYEVQREALKPDVLNAVYRNISPQLLDHGIHHVPSIGYIPSHESVPPPRLSPTP